MNVENILELAAYLEALPNPEQYDQSEWVHELDESQFDELPQTPSFQEVDAAAEWCGTASCIAGHAQELAGEAQDWRDTATAIHHGFNPHNATRDEWVRYLMDVETYNTSHAEQNAARWLGIDDYETREIVKALFQATPLVPNHAVLEPSFTIDPAYTAKVLRHFAATGRVVWSIGG